MRPFTFSDLDLGNYNLPGLLVDPLVVPVGVQVLQLLGQPRNQGNIVRNKGNIVKNQGNIVRNQGNIVRNQGNIIRNQGNIVRN